jgi:hypothetical protein
MTGTEIGVYGSNFVNNLRTDPDPNLECFVDGVSIGREPIFDAGENMWQRWIYCWPTQRQYHSSVAGPNIPAGPDTIYTVSQRAIRKQR